MGRTTYSLLLEHASKQGKNLIVLQGGTSSAKTFSTIELIIHLMIKERQGSICSIVAESMPHLRRGAMRDFFKLMYKKGIYSEKNHNKTTNSYMFPNGGMVEFFSVDSPDALRGGRRDYCFMNEANRSPYSAFEELFVRTRKIMFVDYNPSCRFWVHDYVDENPETSSLFITTYRNNPYLDDGITQKIEAKKPVYDEVTGVLLRGSPNWWRVYGEGQIGSHEGIIFPENEVWSVREDLPPWDPKQVDVYGLDYGFARDETALVGVRRWEDGFIVRTLLYQTGINEGQYPQKLAEKGLTNRSTIIADTSSPSVNDFLKKNGFPYLRKCEKYQGSVNDGISTMQGMKFYLYPEDKALRDEFSSFEWKVARDGNRTGGVTGVDHALDALRYAIQFFPKSRIVPDVKKIKITSRFDSTRKNL